MKLEVTLDEKTYAWYVMEAFKFNRTPEWRAAEALTAVVVATLMDEAAEATGQEYYEEEMQAEVLRRMAV